MYHCDATHQVHAVPGARDETSVGQGVHRRELVKRHALVHVVDRHEFDGAESAVDPADELVDARAEVLVFLHVLPRGDGELDEDDLWGRERGECRKQERAEAGDGSGR
jgi:hypothetical protein